MKFKSSQTGMYLDSRWNSIDSNIKSTTSIIGGTGVVLPIILRVKDIETIINDHSIVDKAKIYIRKVFSDKLLRTEVDGFRKRYIPDQDAYVINPYICVWSMDLNDIHHLAMIEIKSITSLNSIIEKN